MRPFECTKALRLAAYAAAVCSSSCTSEIASPDGPGSPDAPGAPQTPGTGSGGGSGGVTPDPDTALQAESPELFEIALEYFPGQDDVAGRARLARLTQTQLDLTTETLLPGHYTASITNTLPRDPLETNYEYLANLSVNGSNFTPLTSWITDISDSVRADPTSVIDCAASDATCLDAAARAFVNSAFRGVVSDAVLERYSAFLLSSVAEVGLPQAVADLVDVTLSSPNYLFRDEVQTDGEGVLRPANLLQNISYTLADAPPERLGLSLAEFDTRDPVALETTIDRVLSTAEARSKLLRFFRAWLEVKDPDEFDIASNVFPQWTPEVASAAVAETEAFLSHQLSRAAPTLKDVTESTESFVGDALLSIYGVDAPSSGSPVALDPTQRLGVFTQPAVIASHSGPTTTRLVKRGVFFTRKVMCLELGMPPAGVDTSVPEDAGNTERERIETVTEPAACAGCHNYINPFGFMLENYDAIGRWRSSDQGSPVNASITVDFLEEEGPLTLETPTEALAAFTQSMRFQQCFARQMFRFYVGRDEVAGDDPVLRQMFFNFANEEEQDIVKMLRTLASTPAFSRRSEAL